jgi:hypothetical protein
VFFIHCPQAKIYFYLALVTIGRFVDRCYGRVFEYSQTGGLQVYRAATALPKHISYNQKCSKLFDSHRHTQVRHQLNYAN